MKALTPYLLTLAMTSTGLANADVVVAEVPDTTLGKGIGAWAGILVGGAAGGPAGALAAGLAAGWLGGEVQEASGLSDRAYRVKREAGGEVVVRSPQKHWRPGAQVEVKGKRLVAQTH